MSLRINEQALKTAADDMLKLRKRNDDLYTKLEKLFDDMTKALDTPAGKAIQWEGKDALLDPIKDMGLVIEHVSDTLNIIIGAGGEEKGVYYDKLFDEYDEIYQILKNKSTK